MITIIIILGFYFFILFFYIGKITATFLEVLRNDNAPPLIRKIILRIKSSLEGGVSIFKIGGGHCHSQNLKGGCCNYYFWLT
jgi:hypothetical protein